MNIAKANEIRASLGLAPLPAVDKTQQKRRQAANKAAKAQACRELKSKRQSRSK